MQSRRLGKSAIHVSDICMGTMTFGSQTDEAEAHRILDRCFDEGITFYDTAEGYPVPPDTKWVGRTEEIVGRWLKTKNRDAIILATKVSGPSHLWFKSPCRGGTTALDAWVTPDRYRFAIPVIHKEARGGKVLDDTFGVPIGFLRWWMLAPLDGELLTLDGDTMILGDGGATYAVSADVAKGSINVTRRERGHVDALAIDVNRRALDADPLHRVRHLGRRQEAPGTAGRIEAPVVVARAREHATVFLPAASSFEKDGTFMNAERRVQRVRAAITPRGQARPDWQIVCDVARAMGHADGFAFRSPREIWDEIRRVWPAGAGMSYERLEHGGLQWPCPSEDLTRTLEVEGVTQALAYEVTQAKESRRTIGCWSKDIGGDVVTMEPGRDIGSIPLAWFRAGS